MKNLKNKTNDNELIDDVNATLLRAINKIENEKISNQAAQAIINASSAIFKGIANKINIARFVNKRVNKINQKQKDL